MSLPYEKTNAVLATQDFLYALLDPKKTPKVPKTVRKWASRCLRHYPHGYEMEIAATKCPKVFGKIAK